MWALKYNFACIPFWVPKTLKEGYFRFDTRQKNNLHNVLLRWIKKRQKPTKVLIELNESKQFFKIINLKFPIWDEAIKNNSKYDE